MNSSNESEPRTYPARGSRKRLTQTEYENMVLLAYVQQMMEQGKKNTESGPPVKDFQLGKDVVQKFNYYFLILGALLIIVHTFINILFLKRFLADGT